jgi:outer membrane protein assembly factor BamD (BamD/ComL family)
MPVRWLWLAFLLSSLQAAGCICSSPQEPSAATPRAKVVYGEEHYTWESGDGWVKPRRGNWGTVLEIRAECAKAFEAGAYADALEGYLVLKEKLPAADPSMAEVNFRIGECYYHLGDYEEALDYYEEVYRKDKPPSDILNRDFQRMYEISMDYVLGKASCSLLFIPYKSTGHGIDLLLGPKGLITEYPYLAFADDAIMEVAKHYYDGKEYPEAFPLYERVVRDYPRSEWRDLAQFQLAMCLFRQVRGADYDQALVQDTERKFRAYLQENPRGQHAEEARTKLREIAELEGEGYLRKAKFYLRESEPRAARIYLRIVLEKYTTTLAAREAREIQRQLEKSGVGI